MTCRAQILTLACLLWAAVCAVAQGVEIAQHSTVLEAGKFNSLLLLSPGSAAFRINDILCLRSPKKPIVCGQVIQVTRTGILFAPSKKRARVLQVKDTVDIIKRKRSLAGATRNLAMIENRSAKLINRTLFSFGINLLEPFLRFDQAVTPSLAFGLMPTLVSGSSATGTITGGGGFGTMTFYPRKAFGGLWLTGGLGFFVLHGTVGAQTQSLSAPALLGLLGYRWVIESRWHIGIAVGGEYFIKPRFDKIDLRFNGFLPAALLDLGFVF